MGPAAIDENDWTQDSVFAKYDIIVEPQNQGASGCLRRHDGENF